MFFDVEIAMHMHKRRSACSGAHLVCRAAQGMHVRPVECLLATRDGKTEGVGRRGSIAISWRFVTDRCHSVMWCNERLFYRNYFLLHLHFSLAWCEAGHAVR